MPPFETREKSAPDVWLEDSTWVEPRRSRRRDDASPDPVEIADRMQDTGSVEITISRGTASPDAPPPFYDHAFGDEDEDENGNDHRAPGGATPTEVAAVRRAAVAASSRTPFTPAEPAGEVPGLLRRPLVEVQRTPARERDRERDIDRPRFQMPDRIALLAVAIALITLLSAIITAQG